MKQSNIKGTAVYLRVASPCQMGMWAQESKISDYLRKAGDTENVTYFRDNGFSGCTFERPALQAMLEQVTAGAVDKIVIVSLDRLVRNYLLMGELLQMLNAHDVQVVSLNDPTVDNSIFDLFVGVQQ